MNAQAEVDLVDEMKPLLSDSVTVPRSARWRLISRSAVSICANPADTADCSRAPSPVSRKPCEDLVHRRMPRLSSSRPTMRLTATCVTCNSSAASVKLRHLAMPRYARFQQAVPQINLRFEVAQDIARLDPEVVVVATGGIPLLEDLKGHRHCRSVLDALTELPPATGDVLVYDGTGRHNAYVCAERYAAAGLEVTLVTLDAQLGMELGGRGDDLVWRRRMIEEGVTVRHDLKLMEVALESARRTATFVHELTGEKVIMKTDRLVIERGMQPVCEVYDELKPASVNDGELHLERFAAGAPQDWPSTGDARRFELYRIGDANTSRDLHASIFEALRLCRAI